MRKIVYLTGTRADYGLMRNTLFNIKKNPKLKLTIVVTGMHLMPEFGKTINEIKKDKFDIKTVKAIYKKDDRASMAEFIGRLSLGLTKLFKKIKPDIVVLLGDRAEMLAGAIVASYMVIPIAHIHGGEVSSTVDESVRHAITKLANVHLPATKESADRIRKMGEQKNVYVVGAPGMDEISNIYSKKQVEERFKVNLDKPLLLVVQHPESLRVNNAEKDIKETMEAVKTTKLQTIIVYPNADAGGRRMIKVIEKYRNNPNFRIYKNLKHKDFLSVMKYSSVMIGNSSAAIIEAPSFKLPSVNIGKREEGRQRSTNIIDVDYKKYEIMKAIRKALCDKNFIKKVKSCKNPYGDGQTGKRIADILSKIKINKELLEKRIAY